VDGPRAGAQRAGLSGGVLTAAVILCVLGVLGIVGALALVLLASAAGVISEAPGARNLGGTIREVTGFAIAGGVLGVLRIVAGIGVLRRARWGRLSGIALAIVGVLLTVAATAWSLTPQAMVDPFTGEPLPPPTLVEHAIWAVLTAATVAAHGVVVVVLARRADEFAR
jgi:hypothetical protein